MKKNKQHEQLTRYRDFRPTGFDAPGLGLEDRQDWFVLPVIQNRDSTILEESNFASALEQLGGESGTVEVHRFGHWGPGWFEIILVSPNTPQVAVAEDIDRALSDYPVLDEMDYSVREFERAAECWETLSLRDRMETCRRFRVSVFAARRDDIPDDPTGELLSYLAE